MTFAFASIFSGIGGFESGITPHGGECVFASEIDKFARTSYEALYGVVPHGDITQIASEDIPHHDLLVGGFPCQAFSTAGKRAGMAYKCTSCDAVTTLDFNQYADRDFTCTDCFNETLEPVDGRGLLFFELARIARDKQPKALFFENVKGLVNHDKGRTLDTMVKTLWEIGYHVDFDLLNSSGFGVPQNRERIFIVAIRDDLASQEDWLISGSTVIPKGKKRISAFEGAKTFNFKYPQGFDTGIRLRDILEPAEDIPETMYLDQEKTDKLLAELSEEDLEAALGLPIKEATKQGYALAKEGDSVNIQFPGSSTRRGRVGDQIANTLEASGINQGVVVPVITPERATKRQNGRRFKDNDDDAFTLTAQDRHGVMIAQQEVLVGVDAHPFSKKLEFDGFKRSDKAGTLLATDYKAPQCVLVGLLEIKGTEQVRRVYDVEGLSPTLTTMQGGNQEPKILEVAKLNPNRNSSLSNSVVSVQGLSPTLDTMQGGGREPKVAVITNTSETLHRGGNVHSVDGISPTLKARDFKGPVQIIHCLRIRKLTPLECWRLQGFTDEQFYKAKNAGLSNSQLYKQAGNAVTVNVIDAIMQNLKSYVQEADLIDIF